MEPMRVAELAQNEVVRCLGCAQVYSKPSAGGTISKNPGCPDCGYVGWVPLVVSLSGARRRARSGADRPQHPSARRR